MSNLVTVAREDFLHRLEEVEPGLSPKEILEQSSCFVFPGDGTIATFNENEACRSKSPLPEDFKGAVQARKLLDLLRLLPDDQIEIGTDGEQFKVAGKRKWAKFRMEKEVHLPIDAVEKPDKWKPLHPDFQDAVAIVGECATRDENLGSLVYVHVTPDYMEACDDHQLARYELKTKVSQPILVRRDSIKHVVKFDLNEFSETKGWVHFRGPTGQILSCRRHVKSYPDLSTLLSAKGEKAVIPKAVTEAIERSELFSKDNADSNLIRVEFRSGKMKVRGVGVSGEYTEVKNMKYTGPAMAFMIAPSLLREIVNRQTECEVSKNHRLKVTAEKWSYVACLEPMEEKKEEKKTKE